MQALRRGVEERAVAVMAGGRWTAPLAVLAFWLVVGGVTALQRAVADGLGGGTAEVGARLASGLVAGLVWVPLTLLVVEANGRFPLSGPRRRLHLAVHVAGSLLVPLLYNAAVTVVWRAGAPAGELVRLALSGWLTYLHLSAPVYWAVVGVDRWRRSVLRREGAPGAGRGGGRAASIPAAPIPVRSGRRVHLVDPRRVAWIQGAGDYARLHTDDGSFLSSKTLKDLEESLDARRFLRIHRSAIVCLERIRRFRPLGHGDYALTLRDGTELRVSRTRGAAFRRRVAGD